MKIIIITISLSIIIMIVGLTGINPYDYKLGIYTQGNNINNDYIVYTNVLDNTPILRDITTNNPQYVLSFLNKDNDTIVDILLIE